MKFLRFILMLVVCTGAVFAASGQTYDAFSDFSLAQNPNGPWTYGWSSTLAGPLTVFTGTGTKEGSFYWTDFSIEVTVDPGLSIIPLTDGTAPGFPPGVMAWSPGPGNQFTHCKFTAPTSGTYMITGTFTATSYGQPQISILHNGTSLGSSYVSYGTPWTPTLTPVTLAAGDTIDAVIGVGTDQTFDDDEVYFDFTVTNTGTGAPPPVTVPTVYDAFAGFSLTQNPVGAWSYGWSSSLAGPTTIYTGTYQANGTYNWTDYSIYELGDPNIGYQPVAGGLPAGVMGASPGPGNQFTHCTFTAPTAGTYLISGTFTAVSYGDPHMYILVNGTNIADGALAQNVAWTPSPVSVTLAAGDTVDAVEGVGTDNFFFNDEIYFDFTVTLNGGAPPIPPPTDGPTVHDAYAGFSITQNPVGPWTYGWSSDIAGPLTVYTGTFEKYGAFNWTDFSIASGGDPNVVYVPASDGTAGIPAGTMGFSPGPESQYSHCLFTATTAGIYTISGTFAAASTGQPQISILHNGTSLGSAYVSYGTPWTPSFTSVTLAAGDTVDAVIGVGTDQSYVGDEVSFDFTVTSSPIPPPVAGPTVFDAYAGFSLTQNPVGPWSYGWSSNLAGPTTAYSGTYEANETLAWTDFSIYSLGDPNIGYSPGNIGDTGGLPAGVLGASPGPGNQFTHCTFTAPVSGTYVISGTFTAQSYGRPQMYILHNGTTLVSDSLPPNVPWEPTVTSVTLAAGDTIDAVEGVGSDDSFSNDEIYFDFTVTLSGTGTTPPPIPPPAAGPTVYDAFSGFSITQNPVGPWTYGWSNAIAGQLTVYTGTETNIGAFGWTDYSIEASMAPDIGYIPLTDGTAPGFPPGVMQFSPGPGNQFSHCQFTAPVAGIYMIQGTFTATSYGQPQISILHNGKPIGSTYLTNGTPWAPTYTAVTLAAGDTVDAVIGVGINESYVDDSVYFGFTITNVSAQPGAPAAGTYTALLTGTSGPGGYGGILTADVQKNGEFTAQLDLGGTRVAFKGTFKGSSPYSTVIKLKNGTQISVTLGFDQDGQLTGTVSDGSGSFSITGGAASNGVSAYGIYPFTISAAGFTGTGNVPEGTGYGFMYVRPSGAVLIVGHLGDGAAFSTSSIITSGSSVPVYANLYNSTGGLLAGTLNFQDVPSVSDCAGTLFWSRPAIKSVSPYSAGFETSTQFTAAQFNPFISNLNDDDVSFVASGADLLAESSTSVTLHFLGGFLPSYQGGTANVRLMVGAIGDAFMGSFKDPVTNKMDPFVGVLLPKSRTGAGLFFSDGLSGSVNINY